MSHPGTCLWVCRKADVETTNTGSIFIQSDDDSELLDARVLDRLHLTFSTLMTIAWACSGVWSWCSCGRFDCTCSWDSTWYIVGGTVGPSAGALFGAWSIGGRSAF